MGSQCGRLCCRPFRKQQTLKARIENIFNQAPIMISESYCRNKGLKLCEYLKDRRSQIPQCVAEFKQMVSRLTPDSERTCTIILLALKSMCEVIKEFLHVTYICILKILKLPYFSNVKTEVYETLKTTTSLYPDDEANTLEDILNEILRYLSEPKNMTKQEINLLQNLLVPIHTKIAENNAFDWKKLTSLILDRIISSEEIEDEVLLLKTFCKELFEFGMIRDEFFKFLLSFLQKENAWSRGAIQIFKSVTFGLDEQGSVILRLMTEHALTYKTDPARIGECMAVVFENLQSVSTINFSENFKNLMKTVDNADGQVAQQVFSCWSQKVDTISFFRLYRDVLIFDTKDEFKTAVQECNKRIVVEMAKKRTHSQFVQSLVEVVFESISFIKQSYSDFVFKNLAFLIEKLAKTLVFTKIEVHPLFSLIVRVLKTEDLSIRVCKYALKTVLIVMNQGQVSHVPVIFSLIIKIRTILENDLSKTPYLALMIWTLLKSCGKIYKISSLSKYSNKSIKKHLKHRNLSELLLNDAEFAKVISTEKSIYTKNLNINFQMQSVSFKFEDSLEGDSQIEEFEEQNVEDQFLGFGYSENEFSSVSSMDLPDRVIDHHEIHAFIEDDDYAKILNQQEDFDNEILGHIAKIKNIA